MEEVIDQLLPRYLRKYDKNCDEPQALPLLSKVYWLPGFYSLPGSKSLSEVSIGTLDFKSLGYFAMDIASALAVVALKLEELVESSTVLDLCCCPGAKMQLIGEMLPSKSLVIGVDISLERLHVCRSLFDSWVMRMHSAGVENLTRFLAFQADGRTFNSSSFGQCFFASEYILNEVRSGKGKNAMRNKSSRAREKQHLQALEQSIITHNVLIDAYDRVLVDAECTHDASYRHMIFSQQARKWPKRQQRGKDGQGDETSLPLSHNIHNIEEINNNKLNLINLQRDLLANGFKQLKEGGLLVYSTCSQDQAQNEDIVNWLLLTHSNAMIDPIFVSASEEDALIKEKIKDLVRNVLAACLLPDEEDDFREEAETASRKKAKIDTHSLIEGESQRLCNLVSQFSAPPVLPSVCLPGTVRTSYEVGMSGHYIARIRKLSR